MKRRVVITGLGTVNPLANNTKDTWEKLIRGESGIKELTRFNPDEFRAGPDFPRFAGEVRNFNLEDWGFEPKLVKKLDPFCQYALAAAKEAILDSGLSLENEDPYSIGVILGCGLGGAETWEEQSKIILDPEKGATRISAFFLPKLLANFASGYISIVFKTKGPNFTINSACASSSHAIGETFDKIVSERIDIGIAGGADACLTSLAFSGFNNIRALSRRNSDPTKASRPFDKDRDGFAMAEGAGILVLEEMEHALKRRAKIYAEIKGYGATSDASHITNPSVEGPKKCMIQALSQGRVCLSDVLYINAHGTSTPVGDINETKAIKEVFGDFSKKLQVSSTKSMTGHLLGATGAVEAIFTILAIRERIIPPTINLESPDLECDLDYVPNSARDAFIEVALSNSFGFGGTNASLVFKRFY